MSLNSELGTPEGLLRFAEHVTECLRNGVNVVVDDKSLAGWLFLNGAAFVTSLRQLINVSYVDRSRIIGEMLSQCLGHYGPDHIPNLWTLFRAYYDLRCQQQELVGPLHKGMELYNEGLCLYFQGQKEAGIRSMTLALIEDTLYWEDSKRVRDSNAYAYIAAVLGEQAASRIVELARTERGKAVRYPEEILDLSCFARDILAPVVAGIQSRINRSLLRALHEEVRRTPPSGNGRALEKLAQYLLASVDGVRPFGRNVRNASTEMDVVFRLPDPAHTLTILFGPYMVVETKDWNEQVTSSVVRDFLIKLMSVEVRAGILFVRKGLQGLTGRGDPAKGAWREIFKAYHRHHIVIIILGEDNIVEIEKGSNLIAILMREYERIRFDQYPTAAPRRKKLIGC